MAFNLQEFQVYLEHFKAIIVVFVIKKQRGFLPGQNYLDEPFYNVITQYCQIKKKIP